MGALNVAIVGVGIGGLTAAIALRRRGVNVVVYEKADELRELGAAVTIGENGARVYDSLGLRDSLAAIAGKISTITWKTWRNESLPGYKLRYLELWQSDHFEDVSLAQWLAFTPWELVKAHLNIDRSVLANVSMQKTPVAGL